MFRFFQIYHYHRLKDGHPPFLGSELELKWSELSTLSNNCERCEDKQSMKRLGRIWPKITDVDNGVQAVIDGTRFKRGDGAVRGLLYDDEIVVADKTKMGMIDPEKAKQFVIPIIDSLNRHRWRHDAPRYKRVFCRNRTSGGGKWRDLYIPNLVDHTVAHMVMSACMPAFTRGMHPYCCGSVPGRGIEYVRRTVERWMKDDKQCRYFVKLDIKHFFDNISGDVLISKLKNKIKDKDAMYVLKQIVYSAPVACPVGYYTSPWFANMFLEDLDWFIEQDLYTVRRGRHVKFVTHYLRYVDDMLLIGTSKHNLERAIRQIKKKLHERGLEIKPEWEIKRIGIHEMVDGKWRLKSGTYWCDMGGYKFCKDATILRDGVYLSTKRLARDMAKQEYYTPHQCKSFNAKLGWASKCNSNHFIDNDIRPYVNFKTTRRIISDVDKKREQQRYNAIKDRILRKQCDPAEELSPDCGGRGKA